MKEKEKIYQAYMKDIEATSARRKFGYFNMPASAFAGSTAFEQKKVQKDENGRVKTQQRNIFSGLCANGILKKNFFSYPEHKGGDLYLDPGKADRVKELKQKQKYKEKDTFKPASLNKTICSASFKYVPQKQSRKNPKLYRNEDGKVKTEMPNILSSPQSKINFKSSTNLKYAAQPYDNARLQKRKLLFDQISKRGENAFKPSSPIKPYFSTNKQLYHSVNAPEKKLNNPKFNIQQHDSKFRPAGNHFNDGQFSYPQYVPLNSAQNSKAKQIKTQILEKKDPFKLIKQEKNSKPCPSISLSKLNLMRSMR